MKLIAYAHLDLVHPVEDVELGEGDAGNPRGPYGLPDQHSIEPAAAPLAPGDGAEFAPTLAEPLPELLQREGWRFYRLASAPSRGAAA